MSGEGYQSLAPSRVRAGTIKAFRALKKEIESIQSADAVTTARFIEKALAITRLHRLRDSRRRQLQGSEEVAELRELATRFTEA